MSDEEIMDYESFSYTASSLFFAIDELEKMVFKKDSPGYRFQERCVNAARIFRESTTRENDSSVCLHKSPPDFRRGFRFAVRCIVDMLHSRKGNESAVDEVLRILSTFIDLDFMLDVDHVCEPHNKKALNNET